jgi:hypothetical protein
MAQFTFTNGIEKEVYFEKNILFRKFLKKKKKRKLKNIFINLSLIVKLYFIFILYSF